MGAVAAKAAFVEDEFTYFPWLGGEGGVAFEEAVEAGRAALPAGQGDMGMICPLFGLEPGGLAGALRLSFRAGHSRSST